MRYIGFRITKNCSVLSYNAEEMNSRQLYGSAQVLKSYKPKDIYIRKQQIVYKILQQNKLKWVYHHLLGWQPARLEAKNHGIEEI